jgi:uncharacterized protein (TIGR00730 family)
MNKSLAHVCVFCGSSFGNKPVYQEAAVALGRLLAKQGRALVWGGGHVGLMGAVADAVLVAGGETIGVIPTFMAERELAHPDSTELIEVDSMHARKAVMAERADAFIALPGGYGTGDELFEILTWAQLKIHAKPIGLLNVAGYFDPLLAWLDRAEEDGFIRATHRTLLYVDSDPAALLAAMEAHQPLQDDWASKVNLAQR